MTNLILGRIRLVSLNSAPCSLVDTERRFSVRDICETPVVVYTDIPEDSHLTPRRRKKVNSRLILVMLLKTWFVLFVYQNARDMYIFCGGNELPGYTEAVGARLALSPPREPMHRFSRKESLTKVCDRPVILISLQGVHHMPGLRDIPCKKKMKFS